MDTIPPAYQKIWTVVSLIPQSKVASYGQVADLAGLPGRARMIGKALGKAPNKLQLPWYRVLNSQGKISIPKSSLHYQLQWDLLVEEGIIVRNGRVRMKDFVWKPDMADLVLVLPY